MVVWNEEANAVRDGGGTIVTGYPQGPVNLPMWGAFARAHPRHIRNGERCSLKLTHCRHLWLNGTSGMYWFGHKLPWSWVVASTGRLGR